MGYEPRLISPFQNSLVRYYKPWLIKEDAFPSIFDAYAWRGSIRKREGYLKMGDLGGDFPVMGLKNWTNPATLSQTTVAFSKTKAYFFNTALPIPVFQDITFLANPPGTVFSFNGSDDDYFWASNFAASLWVTNNKTSVTSDPIYFWDGTSGAAGVSGGWSVHKPTVNGTVQLNNALIILPYKGRLVTLNTREGNNTFPSRARWSQIGTPYTSNATAVTITNITVGATTLINVSSTAGFVVGQPAGILQVIGSVGTVLNFNQFNVSAIAAGVSITIDIDTTGLVYTSGGSAQGPGTTIQPPPFEISIFGWRDDITGRGGYNDADTSERIVSADIVKDVLIVFFQRSTWRLRYTGNEVLPFVWERLNTQYGAESTFSNVAFDEGILAFSRYGWIISDTNNVSRIDEEIPDDSFAVNPTDTGLTGLARVQGVRDFYRQMAYWAIPALTDSNSPNEIYSFNYIDKNWSIFHPTDKIRCFGSHVETNDMTWGSLSEATDRWTDFRSPDDKWSKFGTTQSVGFPDIIGGDDLGNVYKMFAFDGAENTDNLVNFGFQISTKSFNPYIKEGLKCRVGFVDLYCTTMSGCEITLDHYINDQSTPVFSRIVELFPRATLKIFTITTGAGIAIITTTEPHNLLPSQEVTLSSIYGTCGPFLNNNTYVASYIDDYNFSVPQDTFGENYTAGGLVYVGMRPNYGEATYVRVYLGAIAHMHRFVFSISGNQILDEIKGQAQFEMQGLVIWSKRAGKIRG